LKVVVLQPSYIPWRGYFDQVRRADLFIFYDDVQYDKHGWRNRNQIKTAQGKQWLTIPVHSKGVTEGIPINQVQMDWSKPWAKNHLKALIFSYKKSPYFDAYAQWLNSVYERRDDFLADFTIRLTTEIACEIGITQTRFMRSSEIPNIAGQKTERLIQILQYVGAKHYISGPTARTYIESERFDAAGITLEYIEYNYPEYPQLYPPYDTNVSILDLMFMTGDRACEYFTPSKAEEK
jgi:hypothetical protein